MAERRQLEIEAQLRTLAVRDLQLWSIGFLVMIVLAMSVISVAAPGWSHTAMRFEVRYVPQLALGLVALVLLLNFYLADKKKELNQTRLALVRELTVNETLEQFSVLDPTTQLFSRSYLPHLFASEMKRSNRGGTPLSLLVMDVVWSNVSPGQDRQKLVTEAADLFRSTFRGSDVILRLDETRFMVAMPNTNADQARIALRRLNDAVESWNLNFRAAEMLLNWTIGCCGPSEDAWSLLRKTESELDELNNPPRTRERTVPGTAADASRRLPVQTAHR